MSCADLAFVPAGARHAHIEGYLLFNPALAEKVAATARAAGCTISLELSSFEVVNAARDWILGQMRGLGGESYLRALEKEPLHEPTLEAMVELGGARGEWRMVAESKRAQIEALSKRDGTDWHRAKLFEEIGDIWREIVSLERRDGRSSPPSAGPHEVVAPPDTT